MLNVNRARTGILRGRVIVTLLVSRWPNDKKGADEKGRSLDKVISRAPFIS
jgi:hypothetical protein